MNQNEIAFGLYLIVATLTTVLLGKKLYVKGEVFLKSIFSGTPKLVQPINTILLIGFYLVNIGMVLVYFTQEMNLLTVLDIVEFLLTKLGGIYLIIGGMHMFNLSLFLYLEHKFDL
ncbi:hypothetical protein V6R21_06730 [Limibacter armeniacum]|uniref:hypothetical protein n=1 Tax=Limibacter armeniacum TaxID=466084 RepID=UPI002FE5B247